MINITKHWLKFIKCLQMRKSFDYIL